VARQYKGAAQVRYADIWPRYAKYWDAMTINPSREKEFNNDAQFAVTHKLFYTEIEDATGVPWEMIAVIHRREGNANFSTYLGNGQPLIEKTTIVPIGRGPFLGSEAFIDGGIDAVKVEGWGSILDWRVEKQLYYCLLFNGVGSEAWGHPSSYIWGGTNIQQPGKWIRDHVWSSTVMDIQPGCAPLLASIAKLDSSVTFTREETPSA
jgi:lysozyme family protein